jgi:hypothetical protein
MTAPTPHPDPVNVTVLTLDTVDYGAGETDRVVFSGCKYRVDDHGTLHVYTPTDNAGDVATFAPGQWASVIRGRVVALAGNGAPAASEHSLKIVNTP